MTTPVQAWQTLQDGNERFRVGAPSRPHQDLQWRAGLAQGQSPIATVLACSDSREAIELLFDEGLGDVFVVRNAGQVPSDSALGSVEYGVGPLSTPLLIVLGHQHCGAVRASIDSQAADATPLPPAIARLIAPILPVARRVAGAGDNQPLDPETVDAAEVGREHVRETVNALLRDSEMISAAVADGSLAVVGATYLLDEGRVVPDVILGLD